MDKAYTRINWQNQPSTSTALGATNLNKIDIAVNEIDNRVVSMDTSKADVATINVMVRNVTFEASTGKITITYQNGTTSVIDTAIEKIVTNFAYNPTTQKIDLTLSDGSTQSIDISAFVTNVDFATSNTVKFTVNANGKTKAEVIDGSITPSKLQPDYLADVTVQAQIATTQANKSQRYAVGGVEEGDTTDNAKYYKEQAQLYKEQAQAIVGVDIATSSTAGIVKGSSDINIAADGTMTVGEAIAKQTSIDEINAEIQQMPIIANNDTTTEEGFAWDARRGRAIRNDLTALTNNLTLEQYSPTNYMVLSKIGRMVVLTFAQSIDAQSSNWINIGTIDGDHAKYLPLANFVSSAIETSDVTVPSLTEILVTKSNGDISIQTSARGTYIFRGTLVYVSNT